MSSLMIKKEMNKLKASDHQLNLSKIETNHSAQWSQLLEACEKKDEVHKTIIANRQKLSDFRQKVEKDAIQYRFRHQVQELEDAKTQA